jgi:hypothetical protein
VEGEDEVGEFFVGDAGAEFVAEEVAGGFGERGGVEGVNGLVQGLGVEEGVFDFRGVVLEALVGAAARRRALAGLPSWPPVAACSRWMPATACWTRA